MTEELIPKGTTRFTVGIESLWWEGEDLLVEQDDGQIWKYTNAEITSMESNYGNDNLLVEKEINYEQK